MSTKNPPRTIWIIASALSLVPAILIIAIWIRVIGSTSNPEIRKNDFLAYFPSFMQEDYFIKGFTFLCCIAAVIFASRSFNQPVVALRMISILMVLIAVLIALTALFSM